MRPPLRTAGLIAALAIGPLLLTSAVPMGAARFVTPASVLSGSGAPVALVPTEPPPGSLRAAPAIDELRQLAQGSGSLHLDDRGVVRTATAGPGKALAPNTDDFLKRYAAGFGLTKGHTLSGGQTSAMPGGDSVRRFQQQIAGIPVLGGEILVTTGRGGSVRGVVADTASAPIAGTAAIDPVAARTTAAAAATDKFELAGRTLTTQSSLWLYDVAAARGASARSTLRPTYWVKVTDGDEELASVLVDAMDGSVVLVASEHQSAKNRISCDLANAIVSIDAAYRCAPDSALGLQSTTRHEGGPASAISDVNKAYDLLGVAYDYYKNTFGLDSFDGRGAQIRATVRVCDIYDRCPLENAFWDGHQFVFGQGWAVDDVVWHEFTHAVTEHASNLFYWYQAGAINEALSDIFGEFIDLSTHDDGTDDTFKAWQLGESIPFGFYFPSGGPLRNMANPNAELQPNVVGGFYWQQPYFGQDPNADNGGVHTNSGPANRAAYLIAAGGPGIPALGLSKSQQLWYRTMHLLPSGANYQELGFTLLAACNELIGYFGFVASDCSGSVWNTVVATQMTDFDGHNFAAPEEALDCANRGEPPVVLFFDDMEHRTDSWVRSNSTYWQQIPSREITYTYAAHGVGSMNGWTDVGQTGNGTYVEMASPVALPADKPAFVNFNHSLTRSRTGVIGVSIYIQANGGGWTLLTGPSTGMGVPDGHIFAPTPGFGSTRIDLTAWMGQSVKVRFVVDSPSNNLVDWYMDDFKIGYCDNRTGAPWRTAGYRTVSGIHLDWTDPYYKPQPFTWDLTYTPAIPGAPASVPSDPSGQYALDLPGADPNITYTITIAAHGGDGRIGEPATIKVLHGPPVSCPTHAPVPLYPAFTGLRRPMPGLPEGSCVRPVTPRR